MRTIVLSVGLLMLLLVAPRDVTADGTLRPFNGAKNDFKKALRAKDQKERARAFRYMQDRPEPQAIDQVLWGYGQIEKVAVSVRKAQQKVIETFNRGAEKMEKAKQRFRDGAQSAKDIERFNKSTRKIEKEMGKAERERKNFETAWLRERALLDSATTTLASILRALGEGDLPSGLEMLRAWWLGEKSTPENHLRWMETLVDVNRPGVTDELHRAFNDGEAPITLRVTALDALAARRDGKALGRSMGLLKLGMTHRTLIAAAIGALTTYHDKRGIVPLITFLERKDIARLRGDAHLSLKSLTGQKHGPYAEPWRTWWLENKKTFKMPPEPVKRVPGAAQKASGTFYGIPTFSDRVLYIIDISASMEWALGGKRGEPGGSKAKMVTARKELIGAIYNLPEGGNFNLILFNHDIVKWAPGIVKVTPANQKKCERWIKSVSPTGLTNIHDALEAGFRMVLRTTGEPDFDTVFFLTDGKPTAGKIRNTRKILEQVREWVTASKTQVHVVAIGGSADIDEAFLMELAEIGGGEYVRRGN